MNWITPGCHEQNPKNVEIGSMKFFIISSTKPSHLLGSVHPSWYVVDDLYPLTCTCNYVYHILNISNVLHVWYMFTDLYPKHDPMYVYKYNVLKHVTYGYLLHTFQ